MVEVPKATLGVVMLDTRFPRPPGDIGNPLTFDFPVLYRRESEATVATVVTNQRLDATVVEAVTTAAATLVDQGATLIATSCGFLAPVQDRLQAAVRVPVITSALIRLPELRKRFGPAPIGIVTLDSRRLSPRHFGPFYDPADAIEGIESGHELYPVISEDRLELNTEHALTDVIDATNRLLTRIPAIRAIVFECTNMSPYLDAVAEAVGRPVFDINQAIRLRATGQVGLGSPAGNA